MVALNEIELAGLACLLIASKYEEIFYPSVEMLMIATDNTSDRDRISLVCMEERILKAIGYKVSVPTPHTF